MRNPNVSGKHVGATLQQLARTEHMFKKALRQDAVVMQRGRCIFCKDHMIMPTAEHMTARNRAGSTDRKNIRASCLPCNKAKGNGDDAWFRRVLHQRAIPLEDTALARAWVRHRLNLRLERSEKNIRKLVGMAG